MRTSSLATAVGIVVNLTAATLVTDDAFIAHDGEFDFVIVGAGLSGLTVANKLSARNHSTLVIEAGPDGSWSPEIKYAGDQSYWPTFCSRSYAQYDEDGNRMKQTTQAGSCIGGSTSINGMVWYRPTRAEIDKLERLGNPGWNWETLEPLMEAIERNIPPSLEQVAQGATYEPRVHGHHGLVTTSFPVPMRIPQAVRLYKQALARVFPGLVIGTDLSDRSSVVSASTSWTLWHNEVTGKNHRCSAADALLWAPSQQRQTLTVLANHTVTTIGFGQNNTAESVAFADALSADPYRTIYHVRARKGVILAAGTLGSTPILERSGIGRPSILAAAGIEELVNLPGVGANLNDQPGAYVSALVSREYWNDTSLIDGRRIFGPEISLVNIEQIWGSNSSSIIHSLVEPSNLWSRTEALVAAGAAADAVGAGTILKATIDLIVNDTLPVGEVVAESAAGSLKVPFWPLLPLSRGHVHVASSNPYEAPIITPRYWTDEFDRQVGVAVARRARDLFTSAVFLGIVEDPYQYPPLLGPDATDAEYLDWLRATASGASHWVGATAMLPRALGGVVDPRLRVYGTERLRVVDAGVLPLQLTSHTMSTLYAVAQRAAQIILEDADE